VTIAHHSTATLASGEDVNEIQLFQDAPAARSASHDPHPLLRPTGERRLIVRPLCIRVQESA
tara:strand:- start:203 stop:388 length:186 start_codon:yes stop_codon:yes gene_type:complete